MVKWRCHSLYINCPNYFIDKLSHVQTKNTSVPAGTRTVKCETIYSMKCYLLCSHIIIYTTAYVTINNVAWGIHTFPSIVKRFQTVLVIVWANRNVSCENESPDSCRNLIHATRSLNVIRIEEKVMLPKYICESTQIHHYTTPL